LIDIWVHVAQDNRAAADTLVRSLRDKFDPLLEFPELGVAREALSPGLRMIVHGRYLAYYVAAPEEIVIVRILHASRDQEAALASVKTEE